MPHSIYGWIWFGVKFRTGRMSRESDCTYELERTGFPPSFFLTCSAGYSTVVGLAYFHLSFPNLIPSKFLSSSAILKWMISINSLLVTHRLVINILTKPVLKPNLLAASHARIAVFNVSLENNDSFFSVWQRSEMTHSSTNMLIFGDSSKIWWLILKSLQF